MHYGLCKNGECGLQTTSSPGLFPQKLDGAEKPWGRGCATKRPFCGCVLSVLPLNGTEA